MGSLVGHVAPGFGFLLIGLWHLFNHIKLHALHPSTFKSYPWFPTPKIRHLEPFLIMTGSTISIAMELFIGPDRHQPLDPDGTIPSNHLRNFEHSLISMSLFVYAAFAVYLDLAGVQARYSLAQLLGALAFCQELLQFHFHSTDHMGVEGQYHLLLQMVTSVSLVTTLMGIGLPGSFLLSFVRSLSITFQGVWFMVMGFMLWTPELVPKGCFIHDDDGHKMVRCRSEEALHRAKSLVNIEFGWYVIGVTISAVSFYLVMVRIYCGNDMYQALRTKDEEQELEEAFEGMEIKKGNSKGFIHMGKSFVPFSMEKK